VTATTSSVPYYVHVEYPDIEELQQSLAQTSDRLQKLKDAAKLVGETLSDVTHAKPDNVALRLASFLQVFGRQGYQILANWNRQAK
jgi:hypothetical protein